MSNSGYKRWGSRRGFRLHPFKRLSLKTLGPRFPCLARLLTRWRRAYGRAVRAVRSSVCRGNNSASAFRKIERDRRFNCSSRQPLVAETIYMRSNSFYSEAIKECLEFIKMNSVYGEKKVQLLDLEEDRDLARPECDGPQVGSCLFHEEISSNAILLSKIV